MTIGRSLSVGERRTIRRAMMIIVPSLLYAYGLRPYMSALDETTTRAVAAKELLSRERTLVAMTTEHEQRARRAEATTREHESRLLAGDDEMTATAALTSYVGEHAAANEVALQQLEAREPKTVAGDIVVVGLQLRAQGDLAGILGMLYAIEHGPRFVRIDGLSIERSLRGTASGEGMEVLSLTATVSGLARPTAADSSGRTASPAVAMTLEELEP